MYLNMPTIERETEQLVLCISPEVLKQSRDYVCRSERTHELLLRSSWFLQTVYDFCYNSDFCCVRRDFRFWISPTLYLDMYGFIDAITLPHYVKRATINHCRIYHDGVYTDIEDYLLAATAPNCTCFGMTHRPDVNPGQIQHAQATNFSK